MTTVSPSLPPVQQRFAWSRLLFRIFVGLLVFVVILLGWCYSIAHSALPQLDGTLTVSGLSAPVTVTRDGHGVPTLEASTLPDLFFAQGYVTAQDRLWQMDVMRRFAAGELSEILGEDLVKHDREQRILGMRQAAKKSLDILSVEDRGFLDAYTRGVNAYVDSHAEKLPVEYRILRYRPRHWSAEDSTLIAAQMIKDLNHGTYEDALAREKILAKLGPDLASDLYVNTSWHDRPPTVARPTLEHSGDQDDEDEDEESDGPESSVATKGSTFLYDDVSLPLDTDYAIGSNNWVVSGAHTISGKPLLSNDMHLGHQMPNLWYEAHLRCANYDVAGVTLPGLPFVVVGHNQRIAWGFTNVGPTVEDVYIETFNAAGQYKTPEGWKDPERRHEVIHVKGNLDVNFDVTLTRHGPIISSLVLGETRPLALRWTLYGGVGNPLFEVNSAQNWEDFRRAFSHFDAPGQNVVYADVDGNIGYQTTGKIPIRVHGDGGLPEAGNDNAHEWTSYIPFEKLPSTYNPPWGIIATANGRISPDDYPYSISTGWEAPWRSARIYRVLESGKRFSVSDMLSLQTDIYSEPDRFFAERFVYAVDHAAKPSDRAKEAVEIMRGWDGRMTADSSAALLAYRSRFELVRLLLEPKLGTAAKDSSQPEASLSWKTYQWGMQSVWLENVLLHQPKRWLPGNYANYNELLTAAVDSAVHAENAPKNLNQWKWGETRSLEIQHPILGKVPILNRWTGPGIRPQSGSGFTVKAVTRTHGPSERMTVDLANLDNSTLNTVTGQAGNFLSPYYMDQWSAWYQGYTFNLPFTKSAVEAAKSHRLLLKPN
ncbi:MAG TPA: penicillin acylase family protein [Terriglobales bacterium]